MTPPIKPSSIVHTREQVEVMAKFLDRYALTYVPGSQMCESVHQAADMLRELAGGVPVSELDLIAIMEHLPDNRAATRHEMIRAFALINQHRAST